MEGKRIVFSTATPNDQGGIIGNESIDFKRFKSNPVVLCQHDWNAPPLGKMVDIKLEGGKYTGLPVFHRLTPESTVYADLYDAGYINACSIGGEAEWKTNAAGQAILKDGFRQCERFNLYEISIVTLPSNPDATTMEAFASKCYDKAELQAVYDKIVTLSSQFKITQMSVKKTSAQVKLKALQTALTAAKADVTPDPENIATLTAAVDEAETVVELEEAKAAKLQAGGVKPNDPSVSQLPGVIKEVLGSFTTAVVNIIDHLNGGKKVVAGAPPITDQPVSKIDNVTKTEQPTPTGLSAEQKAAKAKAEEMRAAAEMASGALAAAKMEVEKEGSSKEAQDAYASAFTAAESALTAALEAETAFKACMDADDGDDDMKADKKAKNDSGAVKTTAAAGKKAAAPVLKTLEQLKADNVKLAPKPDTTSGASAAVVKMRGTRFTELNAKGNTEGQRIINRVLTHNSGNKEISDYQIVLESIMSDGKYAAMTDMLRVIEGVDESKLQAYRNNNPLRKDRKTGKTARDIMQELSSGTVEVLDAKTNRMKQVTTLTSTDNALASPALNTIEWLNLAIFELFPSSSWKDDISMFPAEMTSKNTGLIWANITAQPTVYRGTQPVTPADYQVDDDAVSLTLIPYFLQPMLWNPIALHQLRYDKMTLQWAQAFAYWGSVMDDELIYILSSTVPASSIITSSGYGPNPSFALVAGQANPNNFYYNGQYTGALAKPAYNDIAGIEQIFNNQNFDLAREKVRLIADPTMMKFFKQDPDTKSLLTRWIESNQEDLLKIGYTGLNMRSRVAAFDQATGQIKDPTGVMASTVVSAGLAFVCSQVALGLGMLDVFVLQSPTNYGLRMSADIRIGAVPVRKTFNGTALYTYGTPTV